jgi:formamidopyrimidine-DNA glycosylase
MPELAEVEWYRNQWNAGIGDEITAVRLHSGKYVLRGLNHSRLRKDLVGKILIDSHRHGKQMLFRFSSDRWLGIHLGMTGKTRVETADFKPDKYDHLVLYQRKRALVFTDVRQLGRVRFDTGPGAPPWWKTDPPKIESPAFNRAFFDGYLKRHGKAAIKAVLLMQTGFAGIGNWMADEILWRAGVLPAKRVYRLTGHEREQIFRSTKSVVQRALATTGRDFSEPPRHWLIHQKWKRDGKCPKHQIPLRRAMICGRSTVWCPTCQK